MTNMVKKDQKVFDAERRDLVNWTALDDSGVTPHKVALSYSGPSYRRMPNKAPSGQLLTQPV